MDEAMVARYWCHMCSQMVNPTMEVELKCPHCDSGFVEQMDGRGDMEAAADLGSDEALPLWAPILLRMLRGGSLRRRRIHRAEAMENSDRDRELEAILRRRRRSSAILQLLQALRQGRHREHAVLINPFNQAITDLQGSANANQSIDNSSAGVWLEDYFFGPDLEILMQRLEENDPSSYGTPPALREAVEAMPTVRIEKRGMSCSVCLEDLAVGGEARELPCKHKFHGDCILPWLELHSSCPVCRLQLPAADKSKAPRNADDGNGDGAEAVPWPFNGFFSWSSGSRGSSSNS